MFEALNSIYTTVKEGIDTTKLEFISLKDCIGDIVEVDGFFFNDNSKYGRQVVVVGRVGGKKEEVLINMPSRYVEQFEMINADKRMVKSVLEGNLSLRNIEPLETKNGTTTTCTFVG